MHKFSAANMTGMTGMTGITGMTGMTSMTGMNFTAAANTFGGYSGAIANPLLYEAMNFSSQHISAPSSAGTVKPHPDYPMRPDAAYLRLNDAQTRFHLLTQACLEDLRISSSSPAPDEINATLHYKHGAPIRFSRPSKRTFEKQAQLVLERRAERADRMAEIITQVTPQFAFWASICNFHPERNRYTLELSFLLLHVTMLLVQRFKHVLACPRPASWSADVQPVIQTPPYFAWPSGHATEAFFFASFMKRLQPDLPKKRIERLYALASRIAENRVVAGLHFPVDSVAGEYLGRRLAAYFAALAGDRVEEQDDGSTDGRLLREFDCNGDGLAGLTDCAASTEDDSQAQASGITVGPTPVQIDKSPLLEWLWKKARDEISL